MHAHSYTGVYSHPNYNADMMGQPVIPALRRLRHGELASKANLNHTVRRGEGRGDKGPLKRFLQKRHAYSQWVYEKGLDTPIGEMQIEKKCISRL